MKQPKQIPVPVGTAAPNVIADTRSLVAAVARLQDLATFLLLNGVFCVEDPPRLFDVIHQIATVDFDLKTLERKRAKWMKTLDGAGMTDDEKRALRSLDDLYYEFGQAWGEAGYLIGLAVGQRARLNTLLIGGSDAP